MSVIASSSGATQVPAIGPTSQITGDAVAKRDLRFISGVAPVLFPLVPSGGGQFTVQSADRVYAHLGLGRGENFPVFTMNTGTGMSLNQWDGTSETLYVRVGATSSSTLGAGFGTPSDTIIYPRGWGGKSTTLSPKPYPQPTKVQIAGYWRFPTSTDYSADASGIGAAYGGGNFGSASSTCHQIYFYRNTGSWVLGTSNGTTFSSTSAASADGNFHLFILEWTLEGTPSVTLYVDSVSTIVQTANLPTRPLAFNAVGLNTSSRYVDMGETIIGWA